MMKSKKEIEQLAEQDFNDRQECGHYELADLKSIDYYYDGFTNGYTQCQEDMAEKKYTEDDIKETAYFFVSKKLAANQGILDEEIQDFINSLNKQD